MPLLYNWNQIKIHCVISSKSDSVRLSTVNISFGCMTAWSQAAIVPDMSHDTIYFQNCAPLLAAIVKRKVKKIQGACISWSKLFTQLFKLIQRFAPIWILQVVHFTSCIKELASVFFKGLSISSIQLLYASVECALKDVLFAALQRSHLPLQWIQKCGLFINKRFQIVFIVLVTLTKRALTTWSAAQNLYADFSVTF